MNPKVEYWLELAEYDLDTAVVMYQGGRYLYVGFMCHQVIEKILKACYVKELGGVPPYTHNLEVLIKHISLASQLSDIQYAFIKKLEPLNIESRYPSDRDLLAKALTREKSLYLYEYTKELFTWIKRQLSR